MLIFMNKFNNKTTLFAGKWAKLEIIMLKKSKTESERQMSHALSKESRFFFSLLKQSKVAHACNSSTQNAEVGGLWKAQSSLGYLMTPT